MKERIKIFIAIILVTLALLLVGATSQAQVIKKLFNPCYRYESKINKLEAKLETRGCKKEIVTIHDSIFVEKFTTFYDTIIKFKYISQEPKEIIKEKLVYIYKDGTIKDDSIFYKGELYTAKAYLKKGKLGLECQNKDTIFNIDVDSIAIYNIIEKRFREEKTTEINYIDKYNVKNILLIILVIVIIIIIFRKVFP